MGWREYALAFTAFFLTHSVPFRPPVRPWLGGAIEGGPRMLTGVNRLVKLTPCSPTVMLPSFISVPRGSMIAGYGARNAFRRLLTPTS